MAQLPGLPGNLTFKLLGVLLLLFLDEQVLLVIIINESGVLPFKHLYLPLQLAFLQDNLLFLFAEQGELQGITAERGKKGVGTEIF